MSQMAAPTPINEVREETGRLLESLSPRDREILELRFLSELEYEEIAARKQLTEVSIRKIVSRALKALRGKNHERN
jgi:RNA polymerase sigma factor (sigma-70 family)